MHENWDADGKDHIIVEDEEVEPVFKNQDLRNIARDYALALGWNWPLTLEQKKEIAKAILIT